MPVLDPIITPAKSRDFAVIDLEWVPGEPLDPPAHTKIVFDDLREPLLIPMPVGVRQTKPLKIRLASCYDQVPECEASDYDDDPIRVERFVSFPTVKELLDDILVRENRHKWFFAHAGGLSDMEFVLDEILGQIKAGIAAQDAVTVRVADGELRDKGVTKHEDWSKGEWKVRASFSGSSAIIVHLTQGKNAWHFIDSYWLLRDKLANIGKAIGIKKGDGPLAAVYLQERFGKESLDLLDNQELEDFYRECPMDVLVEYNRVDCEILWKAIQQFEQEILELGGQLQQTIASTGMALCRRAYLKQTIYTSEKINQIAERSYYASRVEVISRNLEDFRTYDINSSFPYSMTFPQPGGLKKIRRTLPDNDDEECIYIAEVDMEVPDMAFPPVPYRSGGRVFFPVGKWRGWFTSTDIRLAIREGCTIHRVYEVYEFEPFYDLKNYVIDIYTKRAAAESDFRRLVLKYLLNCLYGKYAESMSKQEMLINPDEVDREEMQLLQPGIWLKDRIVTIDHRHVPISTHITSLSRRTLYEYGKMCYDQGKPSAYFDSITGDRTVVLKSSDGGVVIDPVEDVWRRLTGDGFERVGEKEVVLAGDGWRALAKDLKGKEGWFPLKKLIRHETAKDLYLLSSKRGQVHVTSDHSLVVGGKNVKPADFVERGMQFETLRAPEQEMERRVSLDGRNVFELARQVRDEQKLPGFIYDLSRGDFMTFWASLLSVSGEAGGGFYMRMSQHLVAGLSYALSQHGFEHRIHYRPDRRSYTIGFSCSDSEALVVEKSQLVGEYVYDLEVEGAHTFVDGVGRVLLHNTDSLNTQATLPCDDKKLGALKLEKNMEWGEFFAPKIYRGEGFEIKKNGTVEPIKQTKAKGFSLGKAKQEAWERFDQIVSGNRIGIQRMVRLRELYRSGMTSPVDILVIKALTFEMLSKRFQFPDGETRPWSVGELLSGDVYPKGFDFEPEILASLDTATKAMIRTAF